MKATRVLATLLAVSTSLVGLRASAQEPPPAPTDAPVEPPPPPPPPPPTAAVPPPNEAPPPPPAAPPAPPAAPPQAPSAVAPPPVDPGAAAPPAKPGEEEKKDEVKDGIRVRGGFSINGGVMFLPNTNAASYGPAISLGGRIGVQFNHYFGLVYQNTPLVTFTAQQPTQMGTGAATTATAGLKAGFADYNSLLAMLTLFNFWDIGAGPSLDFLAVSNETACLSVACGGVSTQSQSSSGVSPGAHARVAFNIGGLNGNGPRRSGFAIGADAHPLFTGAGKGLSLTAGLGGEWY